MSVLALSPRDLQRQLEQASQRHAPLVVDIRRPQVFRRARIAGSHNISVARLLSTEQPDQDLILVASDTDEAEAVAERLHASGFHRRIQLLHGGVSAWSEAGFAVEGSDLYPRSRSEVWAQRRPWLLSLGLLVLVLAAQHADPALLVRASALWLFLGLVGLLLHRTSRELLRRSA